MPAPDVEIFEIIGFWTDEEKKFGPTHAHEVTSVALPVRATEFPIQYSVADEDAETNVGVVFLITIEEVVVVVVPHPLMALSV